MAKISELDKHCGNVWCYCLCNDKRFEDIDEEEYEKIADHFTDIKKLDVCIGCTRMDCGYGSDGEQCEYDDESRDFFGEQISDYVYSKLKISDEDEMLSSNSKLRRI